MRQFRKAEARHVVGLTGVLALMVGVGSSLFHAGAALAGVSARRADMLAAGVDLMPVGTAKQVDRAKAGRLQKP